MPIFMSRGGHQEESEADIFRRCNDSAYGIWTCEDGREVLFNRFYEPIWQRRPGGNVELGDPKEWVPFVLQRHFYNDTHSEGAKRRRSGYAQQRWLYGQPLEEKCFTRALPVVINA